MARVARGEQPHDTKEDNLAYSRKGGKDAAVRKHAVLTCQQCCGRAGETSLLSWNMDTYMEPYGGELMLTIQSVEIDTDESDSSSEDDESDSSSGDLHMPE